VVGNLIASVSPQIADQDDMAQAVYDAFDPDTAEGVQLDNICALVGVIRKAATYTTAILTLGGTPSTVIPAGSKARKPDGVIVALDAEATIGGGGDVTAAATATVAGALEAASGSIDTIVDPVAGWDTVTNAADATIGRNLETDPELRARRERNLSAAGSTTDQAKRTALEEITEITHATCISNRELTADSNGIPGKAFRCVIWPASGIDEDEVAQTIWEHMGGGIRPDGAVGKTITDDQNYSQTIRFSYATQLLLYLDAQVTTKEGYPASGDDLVKTALLNWANLNRPGDDVEPDHGEGYVLYHATDQVPGISAITLTAKIGGAPGAGDTAPITIELTEIAIPDSTRITVTST
jgi:hypothetical protein